MGLRFRKSIKVAPGVKVNFNKNSVSATIGSKGSHYTVNSKGRETVSVGVPGTGLSYTKTSTKSAKKGSHSIANQDPPSNSSNKGRRRRHSNRKKWYQKTGWILFFLIVFFPLGLFLMWKYSSWNKIIKLILSFFFGIVFMGIAFSPKLESVTLTADTDTVYDIDDTVKIKIKTDPKDYNIHKDDFDISGGTLDIDDNKVIFTAEEAGEYKISVEKSGVTSNTLILKYQDKSALNKQKEERIAAEQERQEKLAEEQAEKERLANEQSEQEKQATTQTDQEANSSAQSTVQTDQSQQKTEAIVYLSATGQKYHSIPNCGRMDPDNARQISLSNAEAQGYRPCSKCH